jgi:peptide deformylase
MMAAKQIVIWPDPRLRQETRAVTDFSDEVRTLYQDLVDTMFVHKGLGIAAIQIGDPTKMFLVDAALAGREENSDPMAFINPEILWTSGESHKADEGCLSFPGVYVPVERAIRVRVQAMDLSGESFEVEAEGLYARCLLHECDHLTGKLLADFVGPLKRQMIKRKLSKLSSDESAA